MPDSVIATTSTKEKIISIASVADAKAQGSEYTMVKEINLFSLIIAITLFIAFLLARLGMGDTINFLPLILSISILLLPIALQKILNIRVALLQLFVIGFFFFVGWASIFLQVNLNLILYPICAFALYFFFRGLSFPINQIFLIKILLFLCIAISLLSAVWVQNYMNPLSPEIFSLNLGFGHVDSLYLAALTSNIKTYSVASLGLFGLQPIQYHLGSNFLFASYSQLCDMSVMQFYNAAFPIIFAPLFCQSLLLAATSHRKHSVITFSSFAVLLLILNGFVTNDVGVKYLLPSTQDSHFLSQSYCISLIYSFLAIAIYFPFLRKDQLFNKKIIHTLLIFMIPLCFFIIGYTKVSTGIVLFAVFIYLILRSGLIFERRMFISTIISALVIYWVMSETVDSNVKNFNIDFGDFYKTFVKGNIIIYFFLHLIWLFFLFLVIFLLNRKNTTGVFTELTNAKKIVIKIVIDKAGIVGQWISGKYLLVELVIVCGIVGMLPGLLIHIEGGSAYYFSDIQYWLIAIALIGLAPFIVKKYHNFQKFWKVISFFVMMAASIHALVGGFLFIKRNIQIKTALVYGGEQTFKEKISVTNLKKLMKDLTRNLNSSNYHKSFIAKANISLLDSLQRLPQNVKRTSLLYCEDPAQLENFLKCGEATFYISALSEIALINGTYWTKSCPGISAYGMYQYYNLPDRVTLEEAKKFTKEMGFKNLISINLEKGSCYMITI